MIGFAIETFVATTLLMLLVLVIRAPVRKLFGPGIAYALWLLPVLRMALPPLPESWREQAAAPVAAVSDAITFYVVDGEGQKLTDARRRNRVRAAVIAALSEPDDPTSQGRRAGLQRARASVAR